MKDFKNSDRQPSLLTELSGADEFKKSKIGFFSGFSAIRRSTTASFNYVGQSLKIFRLAGNILLPRKSEPSELNDVVEDDLRFKLAAEKFGKSDADIRKLCQQTFWTLWLYFGMSVLALMWGIHLLQSTEDISGFLDYIFPFFPLFAVVPLFLKQALWHHQLRTRSLTRFSVFLKNPQWWLPISPSIGKASLFLLAFCSTILGLSPYTAFAGDTGFSVTNTLGDGDLFYRLLQMVAPIGPVTMPVDVNPWVLPLADAFAAFNTTLLTVGALMLGWHTVVGTVASAYEGEVLGQRWHTIWAPLRVTTGIGSLAPVANGFCAAQVLVIQLVVWGGGIANEVWKGYVGYFVDQDRLTSLMVPDTSNPQVVQASLADLQNNAAARNMILSTLEKQVCLLSIREIYTQAYNNYAQTNNLPLKSPDHLQEADIPYIENQFSNWNRPWWGLLSDDRIGTENSSGNTGFEVVQRGYVEAQVVEGSKKVSTSSTETSAENADFQEDFGMNGSSQYSSVPTAVWNYGEYCGTITMDLSGAEIVEHYLSTVATGEDLDPKALEAQLLQNRSVLAALNKASNRIKDGYPERNIPGFNQIAMDISEVAERIVGSDRISGINGNPPDAVSYRPYLQPGGAAEQALAESYANYRVLMNAITADYLTAINDWANGVDVNDFVAAIDEKGWAAAGSFYVVLAKLQQLKWSMPTFLPEFSEIDHGYIADEHDEFRAVLEGGDGHVGVLNVYANFAGSALQNDSDTVIDEYMNSGDNDGLGGIDFLFEYLGEIVFNQFNPDPFNAMLDLAEMGTKLINFVLIVVGVLFALSFAASAASTLGIGGKILEGAAQMSSSLLDPSGPAASLVFVLKMALMLVLAVGIVHAFVLPMIPYILFLFFVMGMLILVAEALVAAPLWALFHVRLDGQDFVDQVQKPGYMIAFNLLLRPTLAIFGLILSYVVFGAMIWFINETFELAGKSVIMASGGQRIIGLLVMLVLLTYLHYQVAIRSFSLITSLPDRVTRWFGQSGENLGEQNDADKSTNFIVGNVANRVEGLSKAASVAPRGRGGNGQDPGKDGADVKNTAGVAKRGAQQARSQNPNAPE